MRLKRITVPLVAALALASTVAFGTPAARADESVDTEAISEDLDAQIESGQTVEEQVRSLSESSTGEEIAEASASVSALGRSAGSTSSLSDLMSQMDLGPSANAQLIFAQLQIAQAEISKSNAESYMAQIEKTQSEQAECAKMIERARVLQNEAKQKDTATKKGTTAVPDDMLAYFTAHDLRLPEKAETSAYTTDNWDVAIASLTDYQKGLGSSTQTQMTFLQDFIGQYNSYLQSANAQLKTAGQTPSSTSLGQTMLGGEGGTGMLVTGLLGGAAAGVVGTLLVTRAQARRAAEKSGAEVR